MEERLGACCCCGAAGGCGAAGWEAAGGLASCPELLAAVSAKWGPGVCEEEVLGGPLGGHGVTTATTMANHQPDHAITDATHNVRFETCRF